MLEQSPNPDPDSLILVPPSVDPFLGVMLVTTKSYVIPGTEETSAKPLPGTATWTG